MVIIADESLRKSFVVDWMEKMDDDAAAAAAVANISSDYELAYVCIL